MFDFRLCFAALEAQLESEHEERTLLLREKHELERRLVAAMETDRNEKACDEAVLQRLKRDLKRTKALLRDTLAQLERQKTENPGNFVIFCNSLQYNNYFRFRKKCDTSIKEST